MSNDPMELTLKRYANDPMTKWVTNTVLAVIVAALGFLVVADRNAVVDTATAAKVQGVANDKSIAVLQTELGAIRETLGDIKESQRAMLNYLRKDAPPR